MGQRGVRPEQGDGGGRQQHDAADGFDVQETLEGGEGALGQELRARQITGRDGASVHGSRIPCAAARPAHEPVSPQYAADTRAPLYTPLAPLAAIPLFLVVDRKSTRLNSSHVKIS